MEPGLHGLVLVPNAGGGLGQHRIDVVEDAVGKAIANANVSDLVLAATSHTFALWCLLCVVGGYVPHLCCM